MGLFSYHPFFLLTTWSIRFLKIAQINMANNGKGVHWPITWAQWGVILASAPGGPGAIVIASAAVIHPLRNR